MTERVREILSWYEGDNPGTRANIARLLNSGRLAGTGRLVILPVDQGFEHGPARSFAPNPSGYDPDYHFQLALDAGCNAYAAPLGFIEAGADTFLDRIPTILKLNNHDVLHDEKDPLSAVTSSVDDALRLGCAAVGFTIYPGSSAAQTMYEQLHDEKDPLSAVTSSVDDALRLGCAAVGFTIYPGSSAAQTMYEQLREITKEAKSKGLAVVVWSYPRGSDLSKAGETAVDVVAYAAQIAAQLGAHIIKVKPPAAHIELAEAQKAYQRYHVPIDTLADRIRHVVQSAFNSKRIVIFSGGPAKGDEEFFGEVRAIRDGGGFGSIIGRNSFQRSKEDGLRFLDTVMSIYEGSLE
jgi:class I fructose-bisphosphate aldolase